MSGTIRLLEVPHEMHLLKSRGNERCSRVPYLFDTNSSNIAPYVVTIDAIESRTGFDFFVNVPSTLQNAAESQTYSF